MTHLQSIDQRLRRIETIINDETPCPAPAPHHMGIDLGTSDIVVIVTNEAGEPVSAFLEWAEVVRDGVVLDYWGATQIVKDLIQKTEQKLSIKIQKAIASFPPGTDPQASENVLLAAGLEVEAMIDEPSSVIRLLNIRDGAVVDIGGGTTGIAITKNGKIIYTADEASGGRHITLTIAGNRKISFEEAEQLKRNGSAGSLLPIIQPNFEKMAEIIRTHLHGKKVDTLYLSGGTCCFTGIEQIFRNELPGLQIIRPHNPFYLTPLAIASYRKHDGDLSHE